MLLIINQADSGQWRQASAGGNLIERVIGPDLQAPIAYIPDLKRQIPYDLPLIIKRPLLAVGGSGVPVEYVASDRRRQVRKIIVKDVHRVNTRWILGTEERETVGNGRGAGKK